MSTGSNQGHQEGKIVAVDVGYVNEESRSTHSSKGRVRVRDSYG